MTETLPFEPSRERMPLNIILIAFLPALFGALGGLGTFFWGLMTLNGDKLLWGVAIVILAVIYEVIALRIMVRDDD